MSHVANDADDDADGDDDGDAADVCVYRVPTVDGCSINAVNNGQAFSSGAGGASGAGGCGGGGAGGGGVA